MPGISLCKRSVRDRRRLGSAATRLGHRGAIHPSLPNRRERSFGSFERSVQLPDNIEADKIEAIFKNGVFSVALPESAGARRQVKKIEVEGLALGRAAPGLFSLAALFG